MPSEIKELMMSEITAEFENHPYAFISHFKGMNVAQLSDLRKKLGKVSNRTRMMKHALAKKVLEGQKCSEAEKFLTGAVLITFGKEEPQLISKAIVDFAKENDKFISGGVIFEDQVYDQTFVKRLAGLPNRKELLTQVVVRMKSPISGIVLTLNQLLRGVVVALNEIKKVKEAQTQTA
jgi:large subunit ribosomal protein L10